VQGVHRQLQSGNLPRFCVNQKKRTRETDLNQIVRKVQSVLAPLVRSNGAITVHIALSQEPLKIRAASDLMVGAVVSLVRSALQALPGSGTLSLSAAQVDFTYESIIDGNQYRYGACAALAIAGRGIDGWGTLLDPILAGKPGNDKDRELSTAYTIIKEHHGSMRKQRIAGHGALITVYLPLARLTDRLAEKYDIFS